MTGPAVLPETASQTAGPYVHIGLVPNASGISGVYDSDPGSVMVSDATEGQRIALTGAIFDGQGAAVTDALVEIWQADAHGRFGSADPRGPGDPAFSGWGRSACDPETGDWSFATIKPGAVSAPDGSLTAPHITFWIVARGINVGLHTRLYFPGEAANETDPVLAAIAPADRVRTLIARQVEPNMFRFNIHLQGPEETVFFDV